MYCFGKIRLVLEAEFDDDPLVNLLSYTSLFYN